MNLPKIKQSKHTFYLHNFFINKITAIIKDNEIWFVLEDLKLDKFLKNSKHKNDLLSNAEVFKENRKVHIISARKLFLFFQELNYSYYNYDWFIQIRNIIGKIYNKLSFKQKIKITKVCYIDDIDIKNHLNEIKDKILPFLKEKILEIENIIKKELQKENIEDKELNEIFKLLDSPIDILELPQRAYNCLRKAKIFTIADLLEKTEFDLLSIKNLGRKSLNDIKDKLAEFDLRLLPNNVEKKINQLDNELIIKKEEICNLRDENKILKKCT